MQARDRVLAACNMEDVFPVPTDVWENSIHPILEKKLLSHFKLSDNNHVGLFEALKAHFRWGKPKYIGPELEESSLDLPVSFPFSKIAKSVWGVWEGMETYSDNIFERPLAKAEQISDIQSHSWPDPDWFDYGRLSWMYDGHQASYPVDEWSEINGAYMKLVGGWNPVFGRVLDLFGMEHGLLNLAYKPKLVQATIEHIGCFLEEYYERLARSCHNKADILGFGDDFASQTNMMLSPEQWRKLFLPLWRRLFEIAHKYEMKTMMHMCGSVRPVLGDLIEAGLDIYEVVQITATDMDAEGLKNDFGKDLVFYGGLDVQHLLPNGSVDQVRQEVRRLINILGKGGGYILASTHFLMDDVPYENVLAMYDEARHYVP